MFRALRHRNYRLFFSGQIISVIGTWMQSIAQLWLVYRLTRSSLLLGLVGFAGQIPVFLLAPVGGVFADRHSRHRIVIATQTSAMLLAFILSALTLLEHIQVWQIMLLASLLGVVNAFEIPARQAFIVEMVNGSAIRSIPLRPYCAVEYCSTLPGRPASKRCRRISKSNGGITKYVYPSGQCDENARDQGHTQLGLGYFARAARVAWNQGVDLWGAADNRLALGF